MSGLPPDPLADLRREDSKPRERVRVIFVGVNSEGSFEPVSIEIDASSLSDETAARAWLLGQGFRVR